MGGVWDGCEVDGRSVGCMGGGWEGCEGAGEEYGDMGYEMVYNKKNNKTTSLIGAYCRHQ